jgi:hypothetical protein
MVILGCGDEPPAGTTTAPAQPTGILSGHTDCKTQQDNAAAALLPDTEGCLEYEYDGQSVLILTHLNAGFNCCPGEIVVDITFENSTITIREDETEALCSCLCLFDLDYRIENLAPGEYTIVVDEPYLPDGNKILIFTVNLAADPVGIHCVPRQGYPWGMALD